jgi:hypothetical protein
MEYEIPSWIIRGDEKPPRPSRQQMRQYLKDKAKSLLSGANLDRKEKRKLVNLTMKQYYRDKLKGN